MNMENSLVIVRERRVGVGGTWHGEVNGNGKTFCYTTKCNKNKIVALKQ